MCCKHACTATACCIEHTPPQSASDKVKTRRTDVTGGILHTQHTSKCTLTRDKHFRLVPLQGATDDRLPIPSEATARPAPSRKAKAATAAVTWSAATIRPVQATFPTASLVAWRPTRKSHDTRFFTQTSPPPLPTALAAAAGPTTDRSQIQPAAIQMQQAADRFRARPRSERANALTAP